MLPTLQAMTLLNPVSRLLEITMEIERIVHDEVYNLVPQEDGSQPEMTEFLEGTPVRNGFVNGCCEQDKLKDQGHDPDRVFSILI